MALTSGNVPNDLVGAVTSPANRAVLNEYVRAQRDLDVAMAAMRTDPRPSAALTLSASALRYAEAYSAIAKASFATRFGFSADASAVSSHSPT